MKKQTIFLIFLALTGILLVHLLHALMFVNLYFTLLLMSLLAVAILLVISRFYKSYRRSLKKLEHALKQLKDGKVPDSGKDLDNNLFSSQMESLADVSARMNRQQQELQEERTNRLRSVIDGQDQERQRLSRELHDGIGQSLIAIKLQLEHAEEMGHSQMRASIDVSKGMIDQTIDEVRRVTNALLPAALNEFGLITALRARCEEMATHAGLKVHFENSGSIDRLDNKSKTYLYRIAQEAITNTIKHARATELSISISRQDADVLMVVADNGKGFIFDPVSFAHRNGLQNIRERVSLLDGTFDLLSSPGEGTTLKISIPYKAGNGKDTHHTGG